MGRPKIEAILQEVVGVVMRSTVVCRRMAKERGGEGECELCEWWMLLVVPREQ